METQEQNQNQSSEAQNTAASEAQPVFPNSQYEIPDSKSVPWLKVAGVAFFALVIINIGLFYFVYTKPKSSLPKELVGTEDTSGFLLTKPDQNISRDGYSITFSNPRYENLSGQNNFRVDVTLVNESIIPSIKVIANCDINENSQIVKEGVGTSVENGDAGEVLPGGSTPWTALVILDSKDQKVSSCIYAPEGIFDPNQTIRVVF